MMRWITLGVTELRLRCHLQATTKSSTIWAYRQDQAIFFNKTIRGAFNNNNKRLLSYRSKCSNNDSSKIIYKSRHQIEESRDQGQISAILRYQKLSNLTKARLRSTSEWEEDLDVRLKNRLLLSSSLNFNQRSP